MTSGNEGGGGEVVNLLTCRKPKNAKEHVDQNISELKPELEHESWRDGGWIQVGCGMKPAEFLKVRTREGISGSVVTTWDMASGDREMELASNKNKAAHKMHGQGSREEPELMIATTACLSQTNSTCKHAH